MFNLLSLSAVFLAIIQVPASESKSLWSSHPAIYRTGNDSVLKTGYPVGNGKLGGEHQCPVQSATAKQKRRRSVW